MSENEKIISDRAQKEWIPGCPVQVRQIRLVRENGVISARITSAVCGGFAIRTYTADLTYTGAKRQNVGESRDVVLTVGESAPVTVPFEEAVYAAVTVRSVTYADGRTWSNETGTRGELLPEQEIYWQTDPLYDAVRLECMGVTDAKYKPDRPDGYGGAWRCACGQVNLAESETCGACGCSREWLDLHLAPSYLEERQKEIADKTEKEAVRIKKKRERGVSDRVKMILIFAALGLAAALVVLTFTTFLPLSRYSKAVSLAEAGEFDEAIALFTNLGDFRDAKSQVASVNYRKAQALTGLEEVNMTTSVRSPWFSISDDGVLSFKKDEYEDRGGTWEHFVVPDVVDNVVVRELDRNFFMNCKELTAVTLSDCVEVIGEQCFYNCELLHTVNFGKNVKTILPRAFINCYALETIEIPDTVTSLGLRAFNNCIRLNKVILGSGITEIGSYQFSLCVELERITLKSPITSVGEYAFSECAKFQKIHCRFPESAWIDPSVSEGNEAFTAAEVLFDQ
ncbi:MAG: leucine-rich repeat domain-containing protein [Eubacteriales bacterium]